MRRLKQMVVLVVISFIVPSIVGAKVISNSSAPEYLSDKNIFVANGTPITINDVDGKTVITWEGNSEGVEVSANSLVVGGYYNPTCDDSECSIELETTSITMNGGTIDYISGGNVITDFTKFSKIYVKNTTININGGTVYDVVGVTSANRTFADVAVSTSKVTDTSTGRITYDAMRRYYYADKVEINVKDAIVTGRIIATSSYTYAKDFSVNVTNSTVKYETGTGVGIGAGSNGVVDNYSVNVTDSNVSRIDSGQRSMVQNMKVVADGNTTIGDVYAGSFYDASEHSGATWWNKLGNVNYGQVGNMSFDFGQNVVYNNIYGGFQFVEKDKFLSVNASNTSALEGYAKGIENSENAPVVITISSSPKVTDSGLVSMLDTDKDNVKISYIPNISSIQTKDNDNIVSGDVNNNSIASILEETLKNNKIYIDNAINNVDMNVVIEVVEISDNSIKDEIDDIVGDKYSKGIIINYFDASVLLKSQNSILDTIEELSDEIELSIELPSNISSVSDNYTRKYYVVREHEGEYDILDASLSSDGKSVIFKTNKFSNYAVFYVDNLVSEDMVSNPKTYDNILIYCGLFVISVVSSVFVYERMKKKLGN